MRGINIQCEANRLNAMFIQDCGAEWSLLTRFAGQWVSLEDSIELEDVLERVKNVKKHAGVTVRYMIADVKASGRFDYGRERQ